MKGHGTGDHAIMNKIAEGIVHTNMPLTLGYAEGSKG